MEKTVRMINTKLDELHAYLVSHQNAIVYNFAAPKITELRESVMRAQSRKPKTTNPEMFYYTKLEEIKRLQDDIELNMARLTKTVRPEDKKTYNDLYRRIF